VITYRYC